MKHSKYLVGMIGVAACLTSTGALAEAFGMQHGRSVNFSADPQLSVEAGFYMGDIDDADYQHIGARVNYKLDDSMMVYGDIGQSEVEDADGLTYGIGGYLVLDGIVESADMALHGSFHLAPLEFRSRDFDIDTIAINAVFSSKEAFGANQNLNWYGSIGMTRSKTDVEGFGSDSETDLTLTGGVISSLDGGGQLYGGIMFLDDISFGVGYRHFLN